MFLNEDKTLKSLIWTANNYIMAAKLFQSSTL